MSLVRFLHGLLDPSLYGIRLPKMVTPYVNNKAFCLCKASFMKGRVVHVTASVIAVNKREDGGEPSYALVASSQSLPALTRSNRPCQRLPTLELAHFHPNLFDITQQSSASLDVPQSPTIILTSLPVKISFTNARSISCRTRLPRARRGSTLD
jgi:hypothetical protein